MDRFDLPKPRVRRHTDVHANDVGISLFWSEMEYDIKYQVWRLGVNAGVEGKARKIFSITKDDDDWMLRVITAGVDQVREKLKPYLVTHEHMISNELLEKPSEFVIRMRVEDGWRGTPSIIMEFAHLYIVKYAMSEWFLMANDLQRAADYQAEADRFLHKITSEANFYNVDTPIFIL